MLKFIFWSLVLANGVLLAYQQGYFDTMVPSGHEPARLKNQLNPDKVKLLPPPESTPAAEPKPVSEAAPEARKVQAVAASTPTPATTPAPVTASALAATPEPAPKKVAVLACAEIGNFNADEAKKFSARIASLALGGRVSQHPVQEVATHMVYIPPQGDREAAEKKASELRRLGISDFYIIQDNSPMRWGISLGVFRMEEAARAHLASLNQKGVRSARIGQRSATSSMVAFQLHELDEDTKNAVEKIKAGFVKQEIRDCTKAQPNAGVTSRES
ncbi:SPOR domain-containing protein [Herbaspirillum sp. GCM10030257]|uniref:SPOR domain-containing protein n=1 Tax=Herbaspirillum sp. GCM10030257 TaxID=3273393 RepID=UPI00361CCCD9